MLEEKERSLFYGRKILNKNLLQEGEVLWGWVALNKESVVDDYMPFSIAYNFTAIAMFADW